MFKKRIFVFIVLILTFGIYASENLVFTLKENIKELEQSYNKLKKQAKTVNDNIELISRKIEILKEKRKYLILPKYRENLR